MKPLVGLLHDALREANHDEERHDGDRHRDEQVERGIDAGDDGVCLGLGVSRCCCGNGHTADDEGFRALGGALCGVPDFGRGLLDGFEHSLFLSLTRVVLLTRVNIRLTRIKSDAPHGIIVSEPEALSSFIFRGF